MCAEEDKRNKRHEKEKERERERERENKQSGSRRKEGTKKLRRGDAAGAGKMEQKRNQPVMPARIRRQTRRDLHSADR